MFRKLLPILVAVLLALLPAAAVLAALAVTTGTAVDISASSAVLTGNLTSLDNHKSVLVWFEYGTSPILGYTTPQQQHSQPGAFNALVTGLHPGTVYHFRAAALAPIPGAQPVYGAVMTFATHSPTPPPPPPPPPPSPLRVTTGQAHDITGNSAHLNGELDALGNHSAVLVWFDWGTSAAYGNSTARQTHTAPGAFSFPLSSLNAGATYHYRAAALPAGVVGAQPVYGADVSFTTASAPGLQVVTESATGVTASSATIMGNLTSLGSSNAIINVYFEWGLTTAYGNRTTGQPQTKPVVFNATLSGLNANTTYHYRAVAHEEVAGGATVFGTDRVFTTTSQPNVQAVTGSASNITASSAYLNGDLTSMGPYPAVDVWFEWGTTTAYGTITPRHTHTTPGAFSVPISGLYSGTTYHFRAVAMGTATGAPLVYGADRSFTASPTPSLAVVTEPASSVTANSAFLNGDLTAIGGYREAEIWFEWGTTTAYGSITPVKKQASTGAFSAPIANLVAGTTYHFRAVARGDAAGAPVTYGYDRSFTATPTPGLLVTTAPANGITFNSAYLQGDLISLGTFTPVEVWFEWGPDIGYGITTPKQTYTGPIDFSAPIGGLNPGTIYHFRAAARPAMPGAQPVYGNDRAFTTNQSLALAVITEPPTDVTATSATLKGEVTALGNYATVQVWFDWGTTTAYGSSTPTVVYNAPTDFSLPVHGLSSGVIYHYRAVAAGAMPGAPAVYGADMVFIALPAPNPMVITEPADNITSTSATLNGDLTTLGGLPSIPVYFEWGFTTTYGNTTPAHIRTDLTDFGAHIDGLAPGTTYHFRAVAVPGGKPSYGNDMAFTTRAEPVPKPRLRISIAPASGVKTSEATLNGRVESLGNYSAVEVWFEWGKTTTYGNATARQKVSNPGAFSAQLSGLAPDTTYHFRAVAMPAGEASIYSADEAFTTTETPVPLDITLLLGIIIGVLIVVIAVILIVVLRRR